jgi:hypothetical protein
MIVTHPVVVDSVVEVETSGVHHLVTGDFVYLDKANQTALVNDIQPIAHKTSHKFTMPEVDITGFTPRSPQPANVFKVTMAPAIVCDETGSLGVRYIEDRTDPSDFDAMLTEALVLRLAVEIVERVTDSTRKREALMDEYISFMREVQHIEGQEQSSSEFEEDLWISSRY